MDRKREIFEKVLALVRNELWEEPLACSIVKEDVRDILQVAKEQMVSGLVANSIIRNHLPIGDDLTLEVCAIQQLHEKKGREMNAEVAQFAGFLNRRNLQYVIMKGQTMAVLYPNPLMRSTGDIDFYCPKESFESTQKEIEKRLGIVMKHNGSERHDTFDIEGYTFEMHSDLTIFSAPSHQRYWNSFIDEELKDNPLQLPISNEPVSVLPPTINALYIFVHLFVHFIEGGLGLKQLCDWAMVLHHYRNEIDVTNLDKHVNQLGIKNAFCGVGAWLVDYLGLPETIFPLPLSEKDRKWKNRIHLNIVANRGSVLELDEKVGHRVSISHSIGTGFFVVGQIIRFLPLAPKELLWRFPSMAVWSFRKRMME